MPLAVLLLTATTFVLISLWSVHATPWWLVFILVLLAAATMVALWRVGPVMWRDLSRSRQLQHISRMRSISNYAAWNFEQPPHKLIEQSHQLLTAHHYSIRQTQQEDLTLLTAMRGRINRLGFILIHAAVILILWGVLLDSDLWLRYQLNAAKLVAEPESMPLNQMPNQSRIRVDSSMAFQGQATLQTGQSTDEVRVLTAQGALIKHLPFAVAITAVELDTDQLLQENNFLTRIAILDPHLDEPVRAVLGSNRPFHYRGLDYYQQSVTDGGSELKLAMWPLAHARAMPLTFRSYIGTVRQLQTRQGTIDVHYSNLKPRNIALMPTQGQAVAEYKNIGPSLFYRVNDESGSEREFINYMLPVLQEGRYLYISGVRNHAESAFRFMRLPADKHGSLNLFFALHAALYEPAAIDKAINQVLTAAGKAEQTTGHAEFKTTLLELIEVFRLGGFAAINKNIASRVEPQNIQQSTQLSHKLVRSLAYALFRETLTAQSTDETDTLFFEDAVLALSQLAEVNILFYIQLQDMVYKPQVNLLVSYKPGQTLFFTGWVLLLLGLLASFYAWHRRLWLVFATDGKQTTVSIAGMGNRQPQRFAREFNRLFAQLQKTLTAC